MKRGFLVGIKDPIQDARSNSHVSTGGGKASGSIQRPYANMKSTWFPKKSSIWIETSSLQPMDLDNVSDEVVGGAMVSDDEPCPSMVTDDEPVVSLAPLLVTNPVFDFTNAPMYPTKGDPKSALLTYLAQQHRSAPLFFTWNDRGPPHLLQWTSVVFVEAHAYASGRFGTTKCSVDDNTVVWYSKKSLAEHGASARAFDCLLYQDMPDQPKPFLGLEDASQLGGQALPENMPDNLRKAAEIALWQQQEMGMSTTMSIEPDSNAICGNPVTSPKEMLSSYLGRRKIQITNADYYTWSRYNANGSKFTCVLVVNGEPFTSGWYGAESGSCTVDDDNVVWFTRKIHAEHGAAARAYDCFVLRESGERASLSLEEPYGEEYFAALPSCMPDDFRTAVEAKLR
jgi:hypothetical protein